MTNVNIPALIRELVQDEQEAMFTTSIGIIETIDREKMRCEVAFKDKQEVVVDNVPIASIYADPDGYGLVPPLEPGVEGVLFHTKHPIDEMLVDRGHFTPEYEPRRFAPQDAIFMPCIWNENDTVPETRDGEFLLKHPSETVMRIEPEGGIELDHQEQDPLRVDQHGIRLGQRYQQENIWIQDDWQEDMEMEIETEFRPSYIEFYGTRMPVEESEWPDPNEWEQDDYESEMPGLYLSTDANATDPTLESESYGLVTDPYPIGDVEDRHEHDSLTLDQDLDPWEIDHYIESKSWGQEHVEHVSYMGDDLACLLITTPDGQFDPEATFGWDDDPESDDYQVNYDDYAAARVTEITDESFTLTWKSTFEGYQLLWRAYN